MTTPASPAALRAGRGDRGALTEFIRATQDDVWRLLAHLGGRDIADDLTQETYLRVMSALPRFAARSSARTWLLSLARRVWVDNIRHDMARPRKSVTEYEDAAATTPVDGANASSWSEWIHARTLIDACPRTPRGPHPHPGARLTYERLPRRRVRIGTIRSRSPCSDRSIQPTARTPTGWTQARPAPESRKRPPPQRDGGTSKFACRVRD